MARSTWKRTRRKRLSATRLRGSCSTFDAGHPLELLNLGYVGIVVGRAARSTLRDVIGARILTPLGMTATVWEAEQVRGGKLAPANIPPTAPRRNTPARLGAIEGAGAIYSSVRDMAKYVAFQLSAYPPRNDADGGKIKRASVREAHSTGVPAGFKSEPPAATMSYGFGWSRFSTCELDDLVTHNGAIESYRADIALSPSRGVGIVALTNFGNGNPSAFSERTLKELAKTGALVPRAAQPSRALGDAMARLLAVYHQWDEAKLASILARPVDPREQEELAGYMKLHGACTSFEPHIIESATHGWFSLECERGALDMEINVNGKGLIQGFVGWSSGIAAPPELLKAARAVIGLHNKWDDKVFAKHLGKGAASAVQMKKLTADFRARHGDCKIAGALHEIFDWGFALKCTKEDVEVWVQTPPGELTQFLGLQLRPPRGAAKRCD